MINALVISFVFMPGTIVTRDDVPDARYVELGSRFPAVVAIGRAGDATLIGDRWLITAAHVARSAGKRNVSIGGRDYLIDQVILHPSWRDLGPHDIALIRLSTRVRGVNPIPIYRGSGERRSVATIVGHGATGTGSSNRRTDDGKRRGATSRVDSVNASWIYFSFDPPPRGTSMEGAPGAGDSGGPAIILVNGAPRVAGISSAGFNGRNGPASYGAVDAFTRVSTHKAWIDSVMSGRPSSRVPAQPVAAAIPSTPIGKRYDAFIKAVKQNSDEAIRRFVRENFDEREYSSRPALVPNLRRIAALLQGSVIERIASSSASALAVTFRTSSGKLTLELVCNPDNHCLLTDWRRFD